MILYYPEYTGRGWAVEEIREPLYKVVSVLYARKSGGQFYGNNYPADCLFTTREAAEAYIRKDYTRARAGQWNRINAEEAER